MATIFFFSIPAHGHTNPTLPLVAELVRRGHRVRYYSFAEFKDAITAAGAEFFDCTVFLPPVPSHLERRVGRDLAALIEMVTDTAVALDPVMEAEFAACRPACVVADSVCYWGRLFAQKYGVPFICSTTTFAFNQHTARLMKQGPGGVLCLLLGMRRINAKLALLRLHGYPIRHFWEMLQNDNDNDTIVYTSRSFQPMAETFGPRYRFVGPLLRRTPPPRTAQARPLVYIALGTVLNNKPAFYRRCLQALAGQDWDVLLSVGRDLDPAALGPLPANVTAKPYVDQIEVLARASVFLTHCGMNSASESLWCGTPMVLFPLTSEEGAVADRIAALGAGLRLRSTRPGAIRRAVETVLTDPGYRTQAQAMAEEFHRCGGAPEAAGFVESVLSRS